MAVSQEADSLEFAGDLGVLRRRWWVVLVAACVGISAAGPASPARRRPHLTAQSTPPRPGSADPGRGGRGRRTSAATRTPRRRSSSHRSGPSRPVPCIPPWRPQSDGNVSVAVPANSSVLQISCQARSAAQASACANAFASAYIQNRNASAAATIDSEQKTVRGELTGLEKSATRLTLQIGSLPLNSPQRASAESQLQSDTGQLKSLANQAASLSAQAAANSGGSIITKATPPATPSSPKKKIILPSGLLAGLLIGLIIAFVRDKQDTRVREARTLGTPACRSCSASPRRTSARDRWLRRGPGPDWTSASGPLRGQGAGPGPPPAPGGGGLSRAEHLGRRGEPRGGTGPDPFRGDPGVPSGQGTARLLGLPESRTLDTRAAAELAAGELSVEEIALQPAGFPGLRVVVLAEELHDLQHAQARVLAKQLRIALTTRS